MADTLLCELGGKVSDCFTRLLSKGESVEWLNVPFLTSEAERFQLWANSLGLFHEGHESLDYRVRDSVFVKEQLSELLQQLIEHSESLLSIAIGEREPVEKMEDLPRDDSSSISSSGDNEPVENMEGLLRDNSSSHGSSSDSKPPNEVSRDWSSFHEVEFRFQSLKDRLEALYSLATRIRNPRNRSSRTIDELYEHIPATDREAHIHELEELETNEISYILRQDILQNPDGFREDDLLRYTSQTGWLVRRAGRANSRRKQQLLYWKDHPIRLAQHIQSHDRKDATEIVPIKQDIDRNREIIPTTPPSEPNPTTSSLATSATELAGLKPEDLKSAISTQSRISTVIDVRSKTLNWPPPPKTIDDGEYFECPYCRTICPARYLQKGAWENHLIHDLQPYCCTYELCRDPNRLYGSRQEWIDHESQHTTIWYCAEHDIEHETQPKYIDHLRLDHPKIAAEYFSEELLGAAMHSSMKVHRDCPFCATAFTNIEEMEDHIAFHLERLALVALGSAENISADNKASTCSADNQQAQMPVTDVPHLPQQNATQI
ncbi:hypothetical protein GGR51DRAFT_574262 [Nemania sp. FL0031]|nr:hypothetical protein GGR51DRAFT_574262 [Nemania sp. FL0031]